MTSGIARAARVAPAMMSSGNRVRSIGRRPSNRANPVVLCFAGLAVAVIRSPPIPRPLRGRPHLARRGPRKVNDFAPRSGSRARRAFSALHPQLLEVELPLDHAQGQVVYLAPIAQLDDGRPLRADDPPLDLFVFDTLLAAFLRLVGVLGRKMPGPILESGLEPVEQRLMGRPFLAGA